MRAACRRTSWEADQTEPSLVEVLSDPIVRALMLADGVDPDEVAKTLKIPVRQPFNG